MYFPKFERVLGNLSSTSLPKMWIKNIIYIEKQQSDNIKIKMFSFAHMCDSILLGFTYKTLQEAYYFGCIVTSIDRNIYVFQCFSVYLQLHI